MAIVARRSLAWIGAVLIAAIGVALFLSYNANRSGAIRLGIAPYQDIAMIVNVEPLGLEKKYGTKLDLVTLGWEEILPAVASLGRALDMGFGGYIEYLTKYENINAGSSDPVLFLYPAYVFKGGAFITFRDDVPIIDRTKVESTNSESVRRFLKYRIGAQRGSVYEMMLFHLAAKHGVDFRQVNIIDTPLDQGFLAAQQGSLDLAEAGLTQRAEAERRGARTVLTMEDLGFADLTGFIVKKSTYDSRRADVENVIRMWFDCVAFVLSDIDKNSKHSLAYLDRTASTRYTLAEYKKALEQEYFPRSLQEAKAELIDQSGRFSAVVIGTATNNFLVERGTIKKQAPLPQFPEIVPGR